MKEILCKNMTQLAFVCACVFLLDIYHTVHSASNSSECRPKNVNSTKSTTLTSTTTPTMKSTKETTPAYFFVSQSENNIYTVTAFLGGSSTLDCEIMTVYVKPNITWLQDEETLRNRNYRFFYDEDLDTTFTIKFDNMMLTDAGTYKCFVGNAGEVKITKTFHVVVKETEENQKLFVQPLQPVNPIIKVGESIKLTCKARGGNDIPKFFRWDRIKSESKISQGKEKNFQTLKVDQCSGVSVFEISSAVLEDSADYVCIISNQRGYVTVRTKITVEAIPDEPSPSNYLKIIIPTVSVVLIAIFCIVIVVFWRIYKRHGRRKRTHSYHYTSTSDG